jgi:hypothetical protein
MVQRIGEWWQANEQAGNLVAGVGNRLQDAHTARTVRKNNGSTRVTDGPFAETKEMIGGFGLINAPDINAAVWRCSGLVVSRQSSACKGRASPIDGADAPTRAGSWIQGSSRSSRVCPGHARDRAPFPR